MHDALQITCERSEWTSCKLASSSMRTLHNSAFPATHHMKCNDIGVQTEGLPYLREGRVPFKPEFQLLSGHCLVFLAVQQFVEERVGQKGR